MQIIITNVTLYRSGYRRGGRAPYFWQSHFYFLHCIQCLKNIFEIEFDFIVAEIRGVFGSVGVYACVCVCVIP